MKNVEFCHIGLAINKRFVQTDATKPVGWTENSDSGNKLWLVFKGVQGTLNIQKMGLDGADLKYLDKSNTEIIKPAIQLSFSAAQPILIRNFGFNALSIEQDNFTSSTTTQGSSANMYDYAYFKSQLMQRLLIVRTSKWLLQPHRRMTTVVKQDLWA